MSFSFPSRYALCGTFSLLALVSACVYAQGTAGLWKLGEAVLVLGVLALAVAAVTFLQESAKTNRVSIIKFLDDHANKIAASCTALLGSVVLLGWYLAATAIIGKRTAPVVTLDQAGIFLVTSSIGGFCLAGFWVRNFPSEDKFACRMMLGAMATGFISLFVFTIAATGGA